MSSDAQPAGPVDPVERAERFLALHQGPGPLLMPNAWDAGSARLLVSLGFKAVASTSSGFAATMGKLDGAVCLNEAMAHSRVLVKAAGAVPVSADLENGFGPDPADVRLTVLEAVSTGLAGCSIEDYSGDPADPIYDQKLAVERVATAVSVAHRGPVRLVVTTWPTPSPGSRPTRRPGPTSSSPRASRRWPTSARW